MPWTHAWAGVGFSQHELLGSDALSRGLSQMVADIDNAHVLGTGACPLVLLLRSPPREKVRGVCHPHSFLWSYPVPAVTMAFAALSPA